MTDHEDIPRRRTVNEIKMQIENKIANVDSNDTPINEIEIEKKRMYSVKERLEMFNNSKSKAIAPDDLIFNKGKNNNSKKASTDCIDNAHSLRKNHIVTCNDVQNNELHIININNHNNINKVIENKSTIDQGLTDLSVSSNKEVPISNEDKSRINKKNEIDTCILNNNSDRLVIIQNESTNNKQDESNNLNKNMSNTNVDSNMSIYKKSVICCSKCLIY